MQDLRAKTRERCSKTFAVALFLTVKKWIRVCDFCRGMWDEKNSEPRSRNGIAGNNSRNEQNGKSYVRGRWLHSKDYSRIAKMLAQQESGTSFCGIIMGKAG